MLRLAIAMMMLVPVDAIGAGLSASTDPEAIADLRVAAGQNDIAEAWLIDPVVRYDHFVQGSRYEPAGLRVRMSDGRVLTHSLGPDYVFEDRAPRLADLDADGRDEIVLVLTSLLKGASLAVYSVVGNTIVQKAGTGHIGRPHRWLNPAGIADFDGDGRLEVAFVSMPHLAKRLEMWRLLEDGLHKIGEAEDFSNHHNGSRFTAMSAVADIDGDGSADLVIPDGSRRQIRVVSFGDGGRDIMRLQLRSPADGVFELIKTAAGWQLQVGTEAGRIEEFHF